MAGDVHEPITPRFIPAGRVGVAVGLALGIATSVAWRLMPTPPPPAPPPPVAAVLSEEPPPAAPPEAPPAPVPHVPSWLKGPAIVNVWLENCRDCMPAFEAWRSFRRDYFVSSVTPIVNVAYGNADAAFANSWLVDDNLQLDRDGSRIVQPLGIGTFTTFVIDDDGAILYRGRPDEPHFSLHLANAVSRAEAINRHHDAR